MALIRFMVLTAYRLDHSSLQEAWSNEGHFSGYVGLWKSIENVQQILRELGMRQAFYALIFEDSDRTMVSTGMKAKILQSA